MPEMLLQLAEKNQVEVPFKNLDEVHQAYQFADLQAFVELYIQGTEVIQSAEDFYLLTMQYLSRCPEENILHAEVFCDTRTYVDRGLAPEMVLDGIEAGFKEASEKWGISGGMIPSFIRHLGPEKAHEDWQFLKRHTNRFLGVGLAAVELGFPASMFKTVFNEVRESGMPVVAHAGEEGPADYVRQAIELLKVDRIDHGNRCLEDGELTRQIAESGLALTVCPLSNLKLKVVSDLQEHPIKDMLAKGLIATLNSDDPAYFGGYVNDNFQQLAAAVGLDNDEIITLVENSFRASFLPESVKEAHISAVQAFR